MHRESKKIRNIEKPLIFHCDRGCQYVSQAFQDATVGMINSYSKKAYPWDNLCIESFHALVTREWMNYFRIHDYAHAYQLVFEFIKAFYNTKRIHSYYDYMSPDDFEKLFQDI